MFSSATVIILIGNYPPDRQQSMERFTVMLADGLQEVGESVEVWKPIVCFGRFSKTTLRGFGKWLGYIDKWILFPVLLQVRKHRYPRARFHICDHSNAPYLGHLPKERSSITCHDVLAIRGAMGYADAYCPASKIGIVLQSWILRHLQDAKRVAVDSGATMTQLLELRNSNKPQPFWRVIPVAFNNDFNRMAIEQANQKLASAGISANQRFVLHVGSSLPRKNRRMLLKLAAALGTRWSGKICFAGQPMDPELRSETEQLGLTDRVIEVSGPDHETLVALYSCCDAVVFPSYSEGFGWPVIEAQACGAPVIASDIEPMPEVSGGAALHASPNDVQPFVDAFLRLQEGSVRQSLIERGFENCKRFDVASMIDKYRALIYG